MLKSRKQALPLFSMNLRNTSSVKTGENKFLLMRERNTIPRMKDDD